MTENIPRLDFYNGQPSRVTGLRGQQLSDAAAMHQMAFQGKKVTLDGLNIEETFDFVIAGAGLSGLSAAYYYRKKFGFDKTILIIDPLSDFGGHATRNEFQVDGNLLIGYGGSESFQSPKSTYSSVMNSLLSELEIDYSKFETEYFQHSLYPKLGLSRGTFFNSEKFGHDKLVSGDPTKWMSDDIPPGSLNARPLDKFIQDFPMSDKSRKELLRLFTSHDVTLAQLSKDHQSKELAQKSYVEFLRITWSLGDEALGYMAHRTLDFFGLLPTQISALEASHYGYPGFQGIGIHDSNPSSDEPYVYHFPDGNASVARLLVRSLISDVAPGNTMEDVVLARFDYSKLDVPESRVRIRLGHSINYAANSGDGHVNIGIIGSDGVQRRIRSRHCTLACFNMAIPYILPELAPNQAEALKQNVKAPLVYTNVAVCNWLPWVKLGVHEIYGVDTFHVRVKLDYPIKMGAYCSSSNPSEPIINMVHVPSVEASDPRSALRAARKTLFSKKFEDFEQAVRSDLTRMQITLASGSL